MISTGLHGRYHDVLQRQLRGGLLLRLLTMTHFFLLLVVLYNVEADFIERILQTTHVS